MPDIVQIAALIKIDCQSALAMDVVMEGGKEEDPSFQSSL